MKDIFGSYYFTSEVGFLRFLRTEIGVVVVGEIKESEDLESFSDIVYLHKDFVWRDKAVCGVYRLDNIYRAFYSGYFESMEEAEKTLRIARRGYR
jgi:hypothetical protein